MCAGEVVERYNCTVSSEGLRCADWHKSPLHGLNACFSLGLVTKLRLYYAQMAAENAFNCKQHTHIQQIYL